MRHSSRLRHVRHFFGLGIAGETHTVCDDRVMWAWTNLHVKVYLGPFIWLMDFKVSRKRKAVTSGQIGKDRQVAGEDRQVP